MKRARSAELAGRKANLARKINVFGAPACALILIGTLFAGRATSIEIPPAAEKKTVILKESYQDAGRVFTAQCGKCHAAPDPVKPEQEKAGCAKGIPGNDLAAARKYINDVRTGKSLYEDRCGRCHDLIDPGSHTAAYWSKNLCTSDECFVKKLHGDEEQQLLLYLSSHAGNQ